MLMLVSCLTSYCPTSSPDCFFCVNQMCQIQDCRSTSAFSYNPTVNWLSLLMWQNTNVWLPDHIHSYSLLMGWHLLAVCIVKRQRRVQRSSTLWYASECLTTGSWFVAFLIFVVKLLRYQHDSSELIVEKRCVSQFWSASDSQFTPLEDLIFYSSSSKTVPAFLCLLSRSLTIWSWISLLWETFTLFRKAKIFFCYTFIPV